ncbi:hypothetical protein ABK040_013786 [Willaertia magna]
MYDSKNKSTGFFSNWFSNNNTSLSNNNSGNNNNTTIISSSSTSNNNIFSNNTTAAVNIRPSSSSVQTNTNINNNEGSDLSVTPDWLSGGTIPLISPTDSLEPSVMETHILHHHHQQEEEEGEIQQDEPEWLTSNKINNNEEQTIFQSDPIENKDNLNLHQRPYELYFEEYDDAILLSENHLFRQILQPSLDKRIIGMNQVNEVIRKHAKEKDIKFFEFYSKIIARFAYECPFEDISNNFQILINELEENYGIVNIIKKPEKQYGLLRCVSHFFLPNLLKPIYKLIAKDETSTEFRITKEYFKMLFLDNGVLPNISQVLFCHPIYAEIYYKAINFLMKGNGPLPLDWRSFIAILASSRHNCKYIVRRLECEFLLNGGDSKWLQGIEFLPSKLKRLIKFNSILCHMPWKLSENDINILVSNDNGDHGWTIAELVHAITILCHFHSLSGLVFGTGVLPDDDETSVDEIVSALSILNEETKRRQKNETQKLVETLKHSEDEIELSNNITDKKQAFESTESNNNNVEKLIPDYVYTNLNNFDCFSNPNYASVTLWAAKEEENNRKFNQLVRSNSDGLLPSSDSSYLLYKELTSLKKVTPVNRQQTLNLRRYRDQKYDYVYKDFDIRGTDTLSSRDYNWEENGYALLSKFYYGAADLLDQEFEFIYNMTDNRCYDIKDVDTSAFRGAIWHYVHRLFGVSHDDYNYEKVNKLLNIDLKKYIKTVACYPERCTREQFVNMGFQFRTREKIHICLLCMEARKQVSMVYGFRAINNYMQGGINTTK